MKPVTLILAVLFFCPSAFSQVEEVYYESGQLKSATPINEAGIFEGIAQAYYPNGQLLMETPYEKGLRHGLERAYYVDGNLKAECQYQNDLQHGKFTAYFPNGEVKARQNWHYGKREGDFFAFYPNGDLRMYGLLESDSVLFAQRFDESGKLIAERLAYIDLPIDTSRIQAPRVYLSNGGRLRAGMPNQVHICLPRVPSEFISYASPSGNIKPSRSDPYALILHPKKSVNEFVLYLRIKTHSSAQASFMKSVQIPVE